MIGCANDCRLDRYGFVRSVAERGRRHSGADKPVGTITWYWLAGQFLHSPSSVVLLICLRKKPGLHLVWSRHVSRRLSASVWYWVG